MSDAHAYVIVGVPWDEVVREEQLKKRVKKFNQNTGEPYHVEESEPRWLVGDQQFDDYNAVEKCILDAGFRDEPFGYWDTINEPDTIIGKELSHQEVETGGGCFSANPDDFYEHILEVQTKLKSIGCNAKPRVFFFSCWFV